MWEHEERMSLGPSSVTPTIVLRTRPLMPKARFSKHCLIHFMYFFYYCEQYYRCLSPPLHPLHQHCLT